MKVNKMFLLAKTILVLVAFFAVSCSSSSGGGNPDPTPDPEPEPEPEIDYAPAYVIATVQNMDIMTRVSYTGDMTTNDPWGVYWSMGDEIILYDKYNKAALYKLTSNPGEQSGTFELEFGQLQGSPVKGFYSSGTKGAYARNSNIYNADTTALTCTIDSALLMGLDFAQSSQAIGQSNLYTQHYMLTSEITVDRTDTTFTCHFIPAKAIIMFDIVMPSLPNMYAPSTLEIISDKDDFYTYKGVTRTVYDTKTNKKTWSVGNVNSFGYNMGDTKMYACLPVIPFQLDVNSAITVRLTARLVTNPNRTVTYDYTFTGARNYEAGKVYREVISYIDNQNTGAAVNDIVDDGGIW